VNVDTAYGEKLISRSQKVKKANWYFVGEVMIRDIYKTV